MAKRVDNETPQAAGGHWYAGSVWPFLYSTASGKWVLMSLTLPSTNPSGNDFYYVLVSAWESNSSYVQLGLSGDYGSWGLTYSWTRIVNGVIQYVYDPEVLTLTPGTTYEFALGVYSGNAYYWYRTLSGNWINIVTAPTGGNYIVLSHTYTDDLYGTGTFMDYTDYEEIWYAYPVPEFNFCVFRNYWSDFSGTSYWTIWEIYMSGAPSGVAVELQGNEGRPNGSDVLIVNHMYEEKPWASIVSPSGWLHGTTTLTATAGDSDGYVVRVRFIWTPDKASGPFWIIGDDINGADGWSISWNCGGPSNNDASVWVAAVALDNSGLESDWSWSNQFGVDHAAPSTPSLSSPSSGSSTSNAQPTFTWNPATDATSGIASYTFQIDTSTAFNSGNLRTISGITTTSYTPDTPLSGGTWHWHVRALDNAGNLGSYSAYWSVTIAIPDFQLWIDPSSRIVQPGGSSTYAVYMKSVYGFSGTISLDKSTNPAEPTMILTLDPSITLAADETKTLSLSVTTTASTPETSYTITVTGASGSLTHSASTSLAVQSGPTIGTTDLVFVRPSTYNWHIRKSDSESWQTQWGLPGDKPLLGDVDGDGVKDIIVWRPSNGMWYILKSSASYAGWNTPSSWQAHQWGIQGDVPLVADFDGDGRSDLIVWRPSNGMWYILKSSANYAGWNTPSSWVAIQWGLKGDKPLIADFDQDGKPDLIVWRPSNGMWYILKSSASYAGWNTPSSWQAHQWGIQGDIPLVGDFDGDGRIDLAVWRPSNGMWYVLKSSANYAGWNTPTSWFAVQWGLPGDTPLTGYFDGDSLADMVVWRPSNGMWYILKSSANYAGWNTPTSWTAIQWGLNGDILLTVG